MIDWLRIGAICFFQFDVQKSLVEELKETAGKRFSQVETFRLIDEVYITTCSTIILKTINYLMCKLINLCFVSYSSFR